MRVDAAKPCLFWQDDQGRPLRRLDRLAARLKAQGKTLVFGRNAGMFHADGRRGVRPAASAQTAISPA